MITFLGSREKDYNLKFSSYITVTDYFDLYFGLFAVLLGRMAAEVTLRLQACAGAHFALFSVFPPVLLRLQFQ